MKPVVCVLVLFLLEDESPRYIDGTLCPHLLQKLSEAVPKSPTNVHNNKRVHSPESSRYPFQNNRITPKNGYSDKPKDKAEAMERSPYDNDITHVRMWVPEVPPPAFDRERFHFGILIDAEDEPSSVLSWVEVEFRTTPIHEPLQVHDDIQERLGKTNHICPTIHLFLDVRGARWQNT